MPGVAIFGITGRMGQALLRALAEQPDGALSLSGAIASTQSRSLGADAALDGAAPTGITITADLAAGLRAAGVALEFGAASGVAAHALACADAGVSLLVGTTGFDAATRAVLEAAAARIPVLIAPNTSLGVNVLLALAASAARALGSGYDIDIHEVHHRAKRDAPSGTALKIGEIVAGARGASLADVRYDALAQPGARAAGRIGFSTQRAGDIVGDHTVSFSIAGERLEITHRATDRMTFARGALRAAHWLIGRPAGLYAMEDLLKAP